MKYVTNSIRNRSLQALAAATCIFILILSTWSWTSNTSLLVPPQVSRQWPVLDTGVGFDLSLAHGAVAISFANGTTIDVARLPGSDRYKATMAKLSRPESQHFHPPYNDFNEAYGDLCRQYYRRARKALGLPASYNAGVLAEMVAALRDEAEAVLGVPVTAATITTPQLCALYGEDAVDIFEYLHIQERPYIDTDRDERLFYHGPALWAGHNLGLCRQYWNATACRDEIIDRYGNLEGNASVVVGVEDDALILSEAQMNSAYSDWEGPASVESELGFSRSDEPGYADAVYARLVRLLHTNRPRDLETTVVLPYGTYGADERFLHILRKAMAAEGYREDLPVYADAPAMSAARGAAEFAKRGPPYFPPPDETSAVFEGHGRVPSGL